MARYTINKDDLEGLIVEKNLAEKFGKSSAKELKLIIDVDNKTFTYQVIDHKEIIYSGEDRELAVDEYNNIYD